MRTIIDSSPSESNSPGLRPTNRGNRHAESEPRCLVDTIRISGAIADHRCRLERRVTTNDRSTGEIVSDRLGQMRFAWDGAQCGVEEANGKPRAWFELSVPKRVRGHNVHGANESETHEVIRQFYDSLGSHWVDWDVDLQGLRVRRLDVVRDFSGVGDIASILDGLAVLPASRTGSPRRWMDPHHGNAQTLTRGPRTAGWIASLYDKGQEVRATLVHPRRTTVSPLAKLEERSLVGRLRFEARLRTRALARDGLETVAELLQPSLNCLGQYYFDRCGYGQPVGQRTWDGVLEQLHASQDPDLKYAGQVWQALQEQRLNLPPSCSDNSRRKYLSLARQWGVDATSGERARGVRLDFALGKAVPV